MSVAPRFIFNSVKYGGVPKKLNKFVSLSMLSISSKEIRILSLSPKNQGFLGKFNYLEKNDF